MIAQLVALRAPERVASLILLDTAAGPVLRAIPGAKLVVIEEAAHSPQLENPEAWLAAVLRHLDAARSA
jgi:pimeloyl-ACP methyl ester carboxylesterase